MSFVGKTLASRDAESIVTDEVEPGEDTELLALFLGQLAEYIEVAGAIVQKLSSPGFSSEILLNLEEINPGVGKGRPVHGV